jgi:hypothetical protein
VDAKNSDTWQHCFSAPLPTLQNLAHPTVAIWFYAVSVWTFFTFKMPLSVKLLHQRTFVIPHRYLIGSRRNSVSEYFWLSTGIVS